MSQRKIFITGATSFTGAFIARAFKEQGFQVVAALTSIRGRYESEPISKARLEFCKPDELVENCSFGSTVMLDYLQKNPVDIFINHGAAIKGYRDASFDYLGSVSKSLHRAREVMAILKFSGCKRFIHTGTVFESDEGTSNTGMSPSSEALSLYGVSKSMVWSALRFFAAESGLPITKVVIPNPIGPLENSDRMAPIFVKMWRKNESPSLKTPHLIRDQIPASWLANVYVDEARLSCESVWKSSILSPRMRRPSGFVLSNEAFAYELIKQLRLHGFSHEVPIKMEPAETREPLERFNTERVPEVSDAKEIEKFWREYCLWLLEKP